MSTKIADPEISNDKLIQTIRTGVSAVAGLSKMRAMIALRRTRSTRKVEVFSSVFANRQELPRFRHMAVSGLLESGAQAERALIENAPHADEFTAAPLAQALGRIGSPDSLPVIRALRDTASPTLRKQVDFAVSLLAYRHNLSGNEVEVPTGNQLMSIHAGVRTLPIVVADARPAETEMVTGTLKREPLGIALTAEGAQRIECDPNRFLLMWNKDFGGSRFARLRERKGLVAALFLASRFENDYSLSSLVLATPSGRDLMISLHKTGGATVFAGSVQFESESSAKLVIRSVQRPGAAAIEFTGTITNGRLRVERAQSAATVLDRKVPTSDGSR